jgi:hypothetical protein
MALEAAAELIYCDACDERLAEVVDRPSLVTMVMEERVEFDKAARAGKIPPLAATLEIRYSCGRCVTPMTVRPGWTRSFLVKPGHPN